MYTYYIDNGIIMVLCDEVNENFKWKFYSIREARIARDRWRFARGVSARAASWRLLIRHCAKREPERSNRQRDLVSSGLATVRFDWPRTCGCTGRLGSSTRFRGIPGAEEGREDKQRLDHPSSAIGSVVFALVATPTARDEKSHIAGCVSQSRVSWIIFSLVYDFISFFCVTSPRIRDAAN